MIVDFVRRFVVFSDFYGTLRTFHPRYSLLDTNVKCDQYTRKTRMNRRDISRIYQSAKMVAPLRSRPRMSVS